MQRALSVWLPTFSTDLVTRRQGRLSRGASASPVPHDHVRGEYGRVILLTREVAARELIARCCARAARAGIAPGMDLAHARSLVPRAGTPVIEAHRPERDGAALHSLACWALRFSPLVEVDPPDGLLIDATGTELVHRGENRLLRSMAAAFARLGLCARIAAAPTFACAQAVARYGRLALSRVPAGREREAIGPLPVAALGLDEETVHGLSEVGVTTIAHVLALPRGAVTSRFGAGVLERLDLALGGLPQHLDPVRPAPPLRTGIVFEGPTDQWESISAAAQEALGTLGAMLARQERGVRKLELAMARPQSGPERVEITLSRPSRNVKHLWSLVRPRLEKVDLGPGVEGVAYTALRTARVRHEQVVSVALGGDMQQTLHAAAGELMDTLVSRLGPDRVVQIAPAESHLPEHALRVRSVMEESRREARPPAVTPADRPTVLFAHPEPAEVIALTPDGPVLSVAWRGERYAAVACSAPERIGAEWWRWGAPDVGAGEHGGERAKEPAAGPARRGRRAAASAPPPDRDYFAVQLEGGRWVWVCRQAGTSRWFVHGEWC